MLDQLADLHDPTAFALIAGFVAADSVIPWVPGEAATLSGAVLAARGELSLLIVFAATWLGAIVGDNVTFALGGTAGRRLVRGRSERFNARVEWAHNRLHERGPVIILVARFIPAGRNAVSLAAGTVELPWRVFFPWDALAALMWATYGTALGYISGRTFEQNVWIPIVISLGLAALLGAAGELAVKRR
jgi:membrane-associated protein